MCIICIPRMTLRSGFASSGELCLLLGALSFLDYVVKHKGKLKYPSMFFIFFQQCS
jgi:hypothetical protein